MKKRILIFLTLFLALSMLMGVVGDSGSDNSGSNDNSGSSGLQGGSSDNSGSNDNSGNSNSRSSGNSNETRTRIEVRENGTKTRFEERIKEKDGEIEIRREIKIKSSDNQTEEILKFKEKIRKGKGIIKIERRKIAIRELNNETKEIIAGRINAKTGLNLTAEDINDTTLLRAYLSNGRHAYVKIMPDQASKIALERLKAKCVERNCTIELKEVGSGNKSRLTYMIETEKDSRVLLIFKKKMKVEAQVDAETGKIIKARKPWWTFLADEKDEEEKDIIAEPALNVSVEENAESEADINVDIGSESVNSSANASSNESIAV